MTCGYCGTVLPADALFCGECGRAVTITSVRSVRAVLPPLTTPVAQPEPWMNASTTAPSASVMCEQCGSSVTPDDIFCGECGFVVRSFSSATGRPRDTNTVERLEKVELDRPDELIGTPWKRVSEPEPGPEPEPEPEPEPDHSSKSIDPGVLEDEIESTRIVSRPTEGEKFVLQFSTGESFTVYGSGLIGRSPKPEPGEYFDQLVRVIDSSRSVSKTHLEFGQEAGSFWVKDRYSGNGTIIREPDTKPIRCHPERRYRIVRGSRVDLGEQFFIVS